MSTWIGLCAAETAADKENPTAVKRTKMNDFMLDPHLKYCDLLSTKTKVRSSRMSICADCNSFPIGPHLSRSCWEDLIHVSSCSVSGRSIRDGGGVVGVWRAIQGNTANPGETSRRQAAASLGRSSHQGLI